MLFPLLQDDSIYGLSAMFHSVVRAVLRYRHQLVGMVVGVAGRAIRKQVAVGIPGVDLPARIDQPVARAVVGIGCRAKARDLQASQNNPCRLIQISQRSPVWTCQCFPQGFGASCPPRVHHRRSTTK